MKILLINLPNCGSRAGYSGLFLPYGMAYISSVLKKNSYSFDCIDLHNEEILKNKPFDLWQKVLSYDICQYDVIAFGGTFLKYNSLKMLSQKISEVNKNIFQVCGGCMATNISDIILQETKINCVCLQEGEATIIELLNCLKNKRQWQNIHGIKYRNERSEIIQTPIRKKIDNLDGISFPDRKSWNFDIIRKAFPYGSPGRYCAIMFASRGCPFRCIFCCSGGGSAVRRRSPENIIEEMKYLKQKHNIRYIRFFDEIFIGSREKIIELCNLMIKEKLEIFWWCQTQIKLVDEELLRIMKQAGCIEIAYGIESGSNAILLEMNKGITSDLSKKVIEVTYSIGIRPSLNLLAGTPSETYSTLKETRDFVMSLNYIDWPIIPTIGYVIPIPNTKLYSLAREKGIITNEKLYLTEELSGLGKNTRTINLTNLEYNDLARIIETFNKEIILDHYSKHLIKRLLSIFGLDHLRLDLIFKWFGFLQIKPLVESLLWATFGKRNNALARGINRIIYN